MSNSDLECNNIMLFRGSLMQLYNLMINIQKDLHEIPYQWRSIEGDTFRISLIDLNTGECCGNISAFSVPSGARLEVWHCDTEYAHGLWKYLQQKIKGHENDTGKKQVSKCIH